MTDTDDPLAHVKVGNADPTRHCTGRVCGDRAGTRSRFVCTRDKDHPGQHIAGTSVVVVAVWPAQPETGATA